MYEELKQYSFPTREGLIRLMPLLRQKQYKQELLESIQREKTLDINDEANEITEMMFESIYSLEEQAITYHHAVVTERVPDARIRTITHKRKNNEDTGRRIRQQYVNGKWQNHSYLFSVDKYSPDEARTWLNQHNIEIKRFEVGTRKEKTESIVTEKNNITESDISWEEPFRSFVRHVASKVSSQPDKNLDIEQKFKEIENNWRVTLATSNIEKPSKETILRALTIIQEELDIPTAYMDAVKSTYNLIESNNFVTNKDIQILIEDEQDNMKNSPTWLLLVQFAFTGSIMIVGGGSLLAAIGVLPSLVTGVLAPIFRTCYMLIVVTVTGFLTYHVSAVFIALLQDSIHFMKRIWQIVSGKSVENTNESINIETQQFWDNFRQRIRKIISQTSANVDEKQLAIELEENLPKMWKAVSGIEKIDKASVKKGIKIILEEIHVSSEDQNKILSEGIIHEGLSELYAAWKVIQLAFLVGWEAFSMSISTQLTLGLALATEVNFLIGVCILIVAYILLDFSFNNIVTPIIKSLTSSITWLGQKLNVYVNRHNVNRIEFSNEQISQQISDIMVQKFASIEAGVYFVGDVSLQIKTEFGKEEVLVEGDFFKILLKISAPGAIPIYKIHVNKAGQVFYAYAQGKDILNTIDEGTQKGIF